MNARGIWALAVAATVVAAVAVTLTVGAATPNQGIPPGAKAMRPGMAPPFLAVGSIVTLVLVKKELTAEILEVDPMGWVKIRSVGDDDDVKGTPWLNLNHVTLIYTTPPKSD